VGWSCLPKDTHALMRISDAAGLIFPLLMRRWRRISGRPADGGEGSGGVGGSLWVADRVVGLTFKAGTDDLRDSPALAVAVLLRAEGRS